MKIHITTEVSQIFGTWYAQVTWADHPHAQNTIGRGTTAERALADLRADLEAAGFEVEEMRIN